MPALTVREPILPEDLSPIQDVFDDACDSHRIPKSSEDAAALALPSCVSFRKAAAIRRP